MAEALTALTHHPRPRQNSPNFRGVRGGATEVATGGEVIFIPPPPPPPFFFVGVIS